VPRYSAPPPAAPPAAPAPPHQPGRVLRAVALTAVSIGVLVLAAAAFVLSYPGLHAVARQAGISAPLARGYPVILDAMLVIACAAVLSLRGAGAVSKFYAWLSLLVLLGATAGADALHSTGTVVPHKDAAFAAAVLPWVLLLIGFGLLLAMMRHFRLHRPAPAAAAASPPAPAEERRPAALPAGPTPAAGPAQLAAATPVSPVPVPGPPVPAPQQAAAPGPDIPAPGPDIPAPRPDIPAQRPAPEPAAAGAADPVPPAPPVPPAADSPQAGRDQREAAANETADALPRAGRPDQSPAAPAEPDLAYLDEDDDLNLDDLDLDGLDLEDHSPGREENPGYSGAGDRDAVVPEEIFAAPPVDDDLTDDDLTDDDLAGRPLTPQPAFHRMWSSPTPPGDEGED
jgi:hypothetical protein